MKCDVCGKEAGLLDNYTRYDIGFCSECWCDKNLMSLVPQLNKVFNDHRILAIKMMRNVRGINDWKQP
jgi:hypothetical protein